MHHIHTQLGIIAIVALLTLSAISVTAAPRAAAAPSVPDLYTITSGTRETWGGQQFNWHTAVGEIPPRYGTHAESAELNKLATSITWTKPVPVGSYGFISGALIGVKVRLPGTYTPDEWAKIRDTPVTVKVTAPYSMATSTGGEAELTFCTWGDAWHGETLKVITSGSASGVASGEVKLKVRNIAGAGLDGSGIYVGGIYFYAGSKIASGNPQSSPSGSAYVNAIVANIQLTWPDGTTAS